MPVSIIPGASPLPEGIMACMLMLQNQEEEETREFVDRMLGKERKKGGGEDLAAWRYSDIWFTDCMPNRSL
jgi:NADH:ubiquinone oxidoreductase subunit B-like Fe-S oxidoreductase